MPDVSSSVPSDLPTTRSLVRSTIVALAVAGVLLAVVVLPAEYGIDPTGLGSRLGLTQMGRIKASIAKEVSTSNLSREGPARSIVASEVAPTAAAIVAPRSDSATVTLQSNEGREIKLSMREGARVTYSWSTDRGVLNYDQHADSTDPPRDYHGYRKGEGVASDQGELVAAFDGWHGWFWRNRGNEPVTVTLQVEGEHQDIKEVE